MFLKRMMTTRNVGKLDRLIRVMPTIAVAVSWALGAISGPLAMVLAIIAVMLLVTAVTGSCSIYYLLGWSTCPVSNNAVEQTTLGR